MDISTINAINTALDGDGWAPQEMTIEKVSVPGSSSQVIAARMKLFLKAAQTTAITDAQKTALISALATAGYSYLSVGQGYVYDHVNDANAPGLIMQIYKTAS